MQVKVTDTEINSFTWRNVREYLERGPLKVQKKKRGADDLTIHPDLGISDPTYLLVSNTVVVGEVEADTATINALSGVIFVDQEVNLRVKGDIVEVFTKKRYKLNEFAILRVKINDEEAIMRITTEAKLLRASKHINTGYIKLTQHPILTLVIEDSKLKIELKYKISLVESLVLQFPSQLKTNIRYIVESHTELPRTEQLELSPKLFYDTVTERTANYPRLNKPPFVAELDCDLLPFQGDTVKWLLEQEFCTYDDVSRKVVKKPLKIDHNTPNEELESYVNHFSFGFQLINFPFTDAPVWYNVYSSNVCTNDTMLRFLNEWLDSFTGRGILSEEMGLGKTVEMISLILLNARPEIDDQNKQYENPVSGKIVKKAKTTLIICPDSIANQWAEEIELHAPHSTVYIYYGISKEKEGTPTEIAEKLASYDIVLTTYTTLQREIHNAQYNPERFKRLRKSTTTTPSYDIGGVDPAQKADIMDFIEDIQKIEADATREREDKTSPLVLLEFWRLVLDEVQMVGSTVSNCCKLATVIPRHHSWGASGTPIKNDINDLFSMASFLKVQPFVNDSINWKQMIYDRPADFINLFKSLTLRHTKEMVNAEIRLPRQERILLSIPFGPIEQDNYQELYNQFLKEVGLDEDGNPTTSSWEPSTSYYESMKFWLKNLRRVCCHANLAISTSDRGHYHAGATNISTKGSYQTMEKVLLRIIDGTSDKIFQIERDSSLAVLKIGQISEYQHDPRNALKIWEAEVPNVEARAQEIRTVIEEVNKKKQAKIQAKNQAKKRDVHDEDEEGEFLNDKNAISLRHTLEILHRFYYFIASAHYQIYNPPLEDVIPGILDTLDGDEKLEDVLLHRALTEDDMGHQNLEFEFYSKAQEIRKEILAHPIKEASNASSKLNDELKLPFVNLHIHDFEDLESTVFTARVKSVAAQLDYQSHSLNRLISKVNKILKNQLFDSVTDPSGNEYNQTLDDQTNAGIYLEFFQRALSDRNTLVHGIQGVNEEKFDIVMGNEKNDLHKQLEVEFAKLNTAFSIKSLLIDSKSLLNDLERHPRAHRYMEDLVLQLKDEFDTQKDALDELKKLFRELNGVYNLRITYFRQLQELSDNVRPFEVYGKQTSDLEMVVKNLNNTVKESKEKANSIRLRVRYLKSLSKMTEDGTNEDDRICVICRGTITIGSLTKCGHKFCRECLIEWLRTPRRNTCPICKGFIYKSEIYHFTFNKEAINAVVGTEHKATGDTEQVGKSEIDELYEELDSENLSKLNDITLMHDYGAKINTIVRQVLYLKRQNPSVQIVVYSQWEQLLRVLGNALTQNGIKHLGSKNTLDFEGKGKRVNMKVDITKFKKDPRITCFLLNAKADASGLNLINATHVFLCEPLVQTALELQAIGRIHRIGQKRVTKVWTFAIKDTVEESIVLLTTRKKLEEKEELDTEGKTKTSKGLIETSGEFVSTDDLWGSFFSYKIAQRVHD